jgi:hypothetical protein
MKRYDDEKREIMNDAKKLEAERDVKDRCPTAQLAIRRRIKASMKTTTWQFQNRLGFVWPSAKDQLWDDLFVSSEDLRWNIRVYGYMLPGHEDIRTLTKPVIPLLRLHPSWYECLHSSHPVKKQASSCQALFCSMPESTYRWVSVNFTPPSF